MELVLLSAHSHETVSRANAFTGVFTHIMLLNGNVVDLE